MSKPTSNELIKFCPHCREHLYDSMELAQHVKECKKCGNRYFIIQTSNVHK